MAKKETASTSSIRRSMNYGMFRRGENRPLSLKRHQPLKHSMEKYGFLREYPIVCYRKDGQLIIKDGQHRHSFAATLRLPVYYVVTNTDFDVATINCAQKGWIPMDFALVFSAGGNKHYQEGIAFCEKYRIPIGRGFALLAGLTHFNNLKHTFEAGEFKVKDREWAEGVADLYIRSVALSPTGLKHVNFISACMACCRVGEFDPARFLNNAARCREKLVSYSTRDAYLTMMEEVYNFGRKTMLGLKVASLTAMKNRMPKGFKKTTKKKATK